MIGESMFLSFEEKQKRTPKNNGYWTGERGNSTFYSNKPEMKDLGCECIRYINGEPDFTEYSRFKFEIVSMTNDRLPYSEFFKSNFEQAYGKLSIELELSVSGVKKWLKKQHYTLHESNDLKTIYVVPTAIHRTYIHAGGVAECNKFMEDEEDDYLIELVEEFGESRESTDG